MKYMITLAIFLFFGCAQTESDDVETTSIFISYSLIEQADGTLRCEVSLRVGGPTGTFLNLSEGDTVTCNDTSTSRSETAIGEVSYYTNLTLDENAIYTMNFTRSSGSSVTQTLSLIEDVQITSPTANQTIQKGTTPSISWVADDGDEIDITMRYTQGSSSHSFQATSLEDSGNYTLPATQTQPNSGASGTYTGSYVVERKVHGAFSQGNTTVVRRDSVDIQLID